MTTPDYSVEIRCPRCASQVSHVQAGIEYPAVQVRCPFRRCRRWFAWWVEGGEVKYFKGRLPRVERHHVDKQP